MELGLFYLRYTTGEPYGRLRDRALSVVGEYVKDYSSELASPHFEAERPARSVSASAANGSKTDSAEEELLRIILTVGSAPLSSSSRCIPAS